MKRFDFNLTKAMCYVRERVRFADEVNIRSILDSAYIADKHHLMEWGTPVFGGRYIADQDGAMNLDMLLMIIGDPEHLSAVCSQDIPAHLRFAIDRLPWERGKGEDTIIKAELPEGSCPHAYMVFSGTESISLREARNPMYEPAENNMLRNFAMMDFAWMNTKPEEEMSYEDIMAPDEIPRESPDTEGPEI